MADTVQMPPETDETSEPTLSHRPLPPYSAPAANQASLDSGNTVFGGSLTRMQVKRDPTSTVISTITWCLILWLVLWYGGRKTGLIAPKPAETTISLVEPPPPPPKAPPKLVAMGGGGGQKGPTPVTRGNPPKFSPTPPLIKPTAAPKIDSKIQITPTVDVQPDLKMAKSNINQIGVPNSPLVGVSMGNGRGAGLGSGNGNGIGPGSGGNMGGGVRRIGGGVSEPVPLFTPEPEFSEEARKAKVSGNVVVYLQVDEQGRPQNVRVQRGIGMGLDEKAVEAVRRYKFKPAMENGHPVRVEMNVEVNFQIF